MTNKLKIFNDPIYGFITIPDSLIFDIIEHPYMQRLRRIQQMGLSHLVYPGAHHSRFHHVLGCMHLMQKTVTVLRKKGVDISPEEEQGLYLTILLHDLGHGPMSHALEGFFFDGFTHEDISLALMQQLNQEFGGTLDIAIQIFTNKYPRQFFYQLISSQLDMDRLDYLKRDSFYTGVIEGSINSDRLIAMLQVKDDTLVIEEKGIYSIEKFLLSRRFMYWQVYLHKTGLLAEVLLKKTMKRVRELMETGVDVQASNALKYFMIESFMDEDLAEKNLKLFTDIDDYDVWTAMKDWQYHEDFVLSELAKSLIQRHLPKIELSEQKFDKEYLKKIETRVSSLYKIDEANLDYFFFKGKVKHRTYNKKYGPINVLMKNGSVKEWLEMDEHFNTASFKEPVTKYYVSYPKRII